MKQKHKILIILSGLFLVAVIISWAAPSLADLCYEYVEARQYDEAAEQCTKQYKKARDNYNRAITLNNRGNAYYYKGQYDRAIEDYNEAIELNPNYTYAYYNRGLAYYQKVQYNLAIQDYDKAIQLNSNYAYIYNNRGNAYYSKGQYDRAIEDCNKVIQFDPNDASAYYNVACLYSIQNKTAKACEWLKKAVEKGFDKWTYIKEDKDLNNIRSSACYIEIMAGKGEQDTQKTPSPDDLTKRHDQ